MNFLRKVLIFGLFTVALALWISLRFISTYVSGELTEILDEEIKQACSDCEFKVDKTYINLVGLNGYFKNARFLEAGEAKLEFKRVDIQIRLSGLFQKKILIKRLDLIDGFSEGVGVNSLTYKFIDQLIKPRPKKAKPPFFKTKLEKLTISKTKFVEELKLNKVIANDLNIIMYRNEDNHFILTPSIKELSLLSKTSQNIFQIGQVSSSMLLKDPGIIFDKLKIKRGLSEFIADGSLNIRQNNTLNAGGMLDFDFADFFNTDKFNSNFKVIGKVSGNLDKPNFSGEIQEIVGEPCFSYPSKNPYFLLDTAEGEFFAEIGEKTSLNVEKLEAKGNEQTLLTNPSFYIEDDKIGGVFKFEASTMRIGDITLDNADFHLKLNGTLDKPEIEINGISNSANIKDYKLSSLKTKSTIKDNKILFSLGTEDDLNGKLNFSGELSFEDFINLKNGEFILENYVVTNNNSAEPPFKLTGKGNLAGPLNLNLLKGSANLEIFSRYFSDESSLRSEVGIKDGNLNANIYNNSNSIDAKLYLSLSEKRLSNLKIQLRKFQPKEYKPSLKCVEIDSKIDLDFKLEDFRKANGSLEVQQLSFGCDKYKVKNISSALLNVKNGVLDVKDLGFSGIASELNLLGSVDFLNAYDLNLTGDIQLGAFASFFSDLDDFGGKTKVNAKLVGPILDPKITGDLSLSDGNFNIESAGFSGRKINGNVSLDARSIEIDSISGLVNDGRVELTGRVFPFDIKESRLNAKFEDFYYELDPTTFATFSGNLEVREGIASPIAISGNILCKSAEFERTLSIDSILKAISNSFTSGPLIKQDISELPDVELDLQLKGSRNIFIVSNIISAELSADLKLLGSFSKPVLKGSLNILSGWFGLKDRRFDITSGKLFFKSGEIIPYIELLGELSVFSRAGDIVYILLEAKGPLDSPQFVLTSDSGQSQNELLNLIATGLQTQNSTLANQIERGEVKSIFKLFDEPENDLTWLLYNLTTIDSVSIEPRLNSRTGLVEPAFVGSKRLTNAIKLEGQNFLTDDVTGSKLRVILDVFSHMRLAGLIDSETTQANTAFGADAIFTILSKKNKFVKFYTYGQKYFSKKEVLEKLRLTNRSRIRVKDIVAIEESLKAIYSQKGFFQTDIMATCHSGKDFCRELEIIVNEGPRSYINSFKIESKSLPKEIDFTKILKVSKNTYAKKKTIEKKFKEVINSLRSEGYISARVAYRIEKVSKTNGIDVIFEVDAREPVTFIFQGNEAFSPKEFLETINLFERKHHFGKNTVKILVKNMERLYREYGYLYATISYEESFDKINGRKVFLVKINEEAKITIDKVNFDGLSQVSLIKLKELTSEKFPDKVSNIFEPKFAKDEELKLNIKILKLILIDTGFPNSEVEYEIVDSDEENKVSIQYKIIEGERLSANVLKILNTPEGIVLPDPPKAPYSISVANKYISKIVDTVISSGYREAGISSNLDINTNELTLSIEAGKLFKIGKIYLSGNDGIKEELVYEKLGFKNGDALNQVKINEGRLNLLKTGLFERVNVKFIENDSENTVEDIKISILEKPLQTLELGGGYNTEFGLHLFGEASDRGLFQDGKTLGLRLDGYYQPGTQEITRGVANLRFFNPNFLNSDFRYINNLRFQKLDIDTLPFDLDRASFDTMFYRTFGNNISFNFGHTILEEDLASVQEDSILSGFDSGRHYLSFLLGALNFDYRDNSVNPRNGVFLNFNFKFSSEEILSDTNFYALGAKLSLIKSIGESKFSFANNIRAASAKGFGGGADIPISQRYFVGGRNSIRGFQENSLGPKGENGNVIGGDFLVYNNFELRYLLTDAISTHAFLDIGSVFLRDIGISDNDLRYGTGLGLRYLSPIGPVGIDIGFPLNREEEESSYRLHFSVGSNF